MVFRFLHERPPLTIERSVAAALHPGPAAPFFWAGFLLLDRTVVVKWPATGIAVLALVIVQSGIEIVMLT